MWHQSIFPKTVVKTGDFTTAFETVMETQDSTTIFKNGCEISCFHHRFLENGRGIIGILRYSFAAINIDV